MPKKKKVSKKVSRKTVRKTHDPLNTPSIRVVVAFVIGGSILLFIYKFLV